MSFNVGSIIGSLKLDRRGWDQSISRVKSDQKALGKTARDTSKAVGGMGNSFKASAKKIAGAFGLGLGITGVFLGVKKVVTDVIEKGREFGKQWANVTTMISDASINTNKLKKELLALSPTLGSSTELAKGMYQVLSASIEPAKAIEFLAEASKSAKAGLTDVATSVDALTTIINAYGMRAEKVTDVSDIMFQTVKRGKLTFGELAHSLGTVAPVAGTIGVRFEELSAGIATLTRQGINAQTATMQLRQVLMAVLKPSKDAKEKAKELGIEWDVASLKAKGLGRFLLDVKEKTRGNTEAYGKLVPNVRALTGVMALAGRASESFVEDLKLMENASGATQEAFEKQMESADFWMTTITNASEKLKISFFEGFISPMKDGIKSADDLDQETANLSDTFGSLGEITGSILTPILKDLIAKFNMAKTSIKTIRMTIDGMSLAIKKGQIPTIRNAQKAWIEYEEALEKSRLEVLKSKDPYFGFQGIIAKSAVEVRELMSDIYASNISYEEARKKIDELRKANEEHEETLTKKLNPALLDTHGKIKRIVDISSQYAEFQKEINDLQSEFTPLDDKYLEQWEVMTEDLEGYESGFQAVMHQVGLWEKDLSGLAGFHKTEIGKMGEDWEKFAVQVGSVFQILGDEIGGGLGNLVADLGLAFSQLDKETEKTAEGILEAIGSVMAGRIGGGLGEIISGHEDSFASLGQTVGGLVALIPGVGTAFATVTSAIGGLIGGLFGKAKTEAEHLAEDLKNQISGVMTETTKWGKISEETAEKIGKAKQEMENFHATSKFFVDIIRDVGINQDNVNDLWARASSILNAVSDGAMSVSETARSAGESFQLLVAEAKELGIEGSEAMLDFIRKVKASGIEVKEVTNYIITQLDRIPSALESLVTNYEESGMAVEDMGLIAVKTFDNMIESGVSWNDAVKKMKAPLSALRDKYAELGIEGDETISKLFEIIGVTEENEALFTAIEANREIMNALANTTLFTKETFDLFGQTARNQFDSLIDKGIDSETALRAMKPTLEDLIFASENYNFTIGEGTQELINQARELGIIKEKAKEPAEKMMDAFNRFADRFDEILKRMDRGFRNAGESVQRNFGHAFNQAEKKAISAGKSIVHHLSKLRPSIDFDIKSKGIGGIGSAQEGFSGMVDRPTPILVHPKEWIDITPMDELKRTGRTRGGQDIGGIMNVFNFDIKTIDTISMEKFVRHDLLDIVDQSLRQNVGGYAEKYEENLSRYRT